MAIRHKWVATLYAGSVNIGNSVSWQQTISGAYPSSPRLGLVQLSLAHSLIPEGFFYSPGQATCSHPSVHVGCWSAVGSTGQGRWLYPLWLSQTSSQLNNSSHHPRLNKVCCYKPMSCHSSIPPEMPFAHALLASQCATGPICGECSQWFFLDGSHNAWTTSLNTGIAAHTICLGPSTSMVRSLSIFLAKH